MAGYDFTHMEGSLRVPLIIRWPDWMVDQRSRLANVFQCVLPTGSRRWNGGIADN
jgi:hypothetical protein